jgi:hypothetical protein
MKLKMSGATPPLPLYGFMAFTGTTLHILFTYILNIILQQVQKFKHSGAYNINIFCISVKKELENTGNVCVWGWPQWHANRQV